MFLYTNYVVSDGGEYETPHRERTGPCSVRPASVRPRGAGDDAEFVRNQYYGLEWQRLPPDGGDEGPQGALGAGALLADTDCGCELRLARAGAFHFYFVYDTA